LSHLEARIDRVAAFLRLGLDAEQIGEKLETAHRTDVAAAERSNEPPPRVRVAAAASAAGALDAGVRRRAVAHHAREDKARVRRPRSAALAEVA
jgi:hypothetical protein